MEDEADPSPSPRSRLSDPLSRLSDVPGSSCSSWSGSNPGSPRLPPRRPSQSPPLHRSNVDWQERCMELQMELHRYRHQAANVRDMLKDKFGRDISSSSQRPSQFYGGHVIMLDPQRSVTEFTADCFNPLQCFFLKEPLAR